MMSPIVYAKRVIWSGLILAGGHSRRMGEDKALLKIGGTTLLRRAISLVRAAGGRPCVVGRERPAAQVAGVRQIDEVRESGRPAAGPLVGLRWGLASGGTRHTFALACDLPLLSADLVRYLVNETARFDAVVPRSGGKLHVLAAAYTTECLPAIDRCLASGRLAVHQFLEEVRTRIVEEEDIDRFGSPDMLANVNTPDDLKRVAALLVEEES